MSSNCQCPTTSKQSLEARQSSWNTGGLEELVVETIPRQLFVLLKIQRLPPLCRSSGILSHLFALSGSFKRFVWVIWREGRRNDSVFSQQILMWCLMSLSPNKNGMCDSFWWLCLLTTLATRQSVPYLSLVVSLAERAGRLCLCLFFSILIYQCLVLPIFHLLF